MRSGTAVAGVRPESAAEPACDDRLEEILRALDPGFLEVVGWDWQRRVITFPWDHPVIGLRDCPVPTCPLAIAVFTHPMCRGSLERFGRSSLPWRNSSGRRRPGPWGAGGSRVPSTGVSGPGTLRRGVCA